MKRLIVMLGFALSLGASAQGVYKTPGANGPVYSDKPQPGAREVTLKPLSVVPAPKPVVVAPPAAPRGDATRSEAARADATASPYRHLTVTEPQDNGSVAFNGGFVEVRLAADPPLRLGEQHAYSVAINGVVAVSRFSASELTIPPEFWGGTLPGPGQSLQLDAMIVDGRGEVVQRAAPVRFFLRHVNVMNAPRRVPPPPRPRPPPLKKNEPPENYGTSTLRR